MEGWVCIVQGFLDLRSFAGEYCLERGGRGGGWGFGGWVSLE